MKKIVKLLFIFLLFQSCINQKITQKDVFNPVKEYELDSNFNFSRYFIKKTDTSKLESWYITENNAQFNLIYFSGNGSNIRSAIPFFNELGDQFDLNIFSFNYSGYGLSEGIPSINGIVSDANLSIDFFTNKLANKDIPTFILGYSLGGYVALNIINHDSIDKGIILSSFSSLNELEEYLIKEALPFVIRPFLKLEVDESIYELNNLTLVKETTKPLLFIHGENDVFIPPSMSYQLFNISKSKNKLIKIIENADHRMVLKDSSSNKQVIREIRQFIKL